MALFSAFYNIRFLGKGKVPWPKPHPHVCEEGGFFM